MKKKTIISALLALSLLGACTGGKTETSATEQEIQHSDADTLLVLVVPDSAIWGHLGEGTGMSVVEFITDEGDTLQLEKDSETTGKSAVIRGEIRNYTDRFCITTMDNGETLKEAINVTQMQEMWGNAVAVEN